MYVTDGVDVACTHTTDNGTERAMEHDMSMQHVVQRFYKVCAIHEAV